jgi:O-antigen/teichoic acid export membrane protein
MRNRVVQVGAYGVATLLQGITAFLMVPLILTIAGREVFAKWVLLEPFLTYGATLGLLGVNYGLLKLIGMDQLSPSEALRATFRKVLMQVGIFTVITLLIAWLWSRDLRTALLISAFVASESLFIFHQFALRGENRSISYAAATTAKFSLILMTAGSLSILGGNAIPLVGILAIYVAGSAFGLVVSAALSRKSAVESGATKSSAHYGSAKRYGMPLMGAVILAGIVSAGDRYAINMYMDIGQVASYVAIVKLANALNMIAAPLNLWFPAARFVHVKDPDGGSRFFSIIILCATIFFFAIAGAIYLFGPALYPHFAPGLDWDGSVAACLLLAAVASALCTPINVGLLSEGRTWILPSILAVVGTVEIGLLYVLIPIHGIKGAAASILAAQLLNLFLIYKASQAAHYIKWPMRRIAALAIGFLVSVATATYFSAASLTRLAIFSGAFIACALLVISKYERRELLA